MARDPRRVVTRWHFGLTGSIIRLTLAVCLMLTIGVLLARAIGAALPLMTVGYAARWPGPRDSFDLFAHDLRTGWRINLTHTPYGDEISWNAARGMSRIVVERSYPGGSEICLLGVRCLLPISRFDRAPRLSRDGSRLLVTLADRGIALVDGEAALVELNSRAVVGLWEPFGGWLWTLYDTDLTRGAVTVHLAGGSFGAFQVVVTDAHGVQSIAASSPHEIIALRWLW